MLYRYVKPGHHFNGIVFKLLDKQIRKGCFMEVISIPDDSTSLDKDYIGRTYNIQNYEALKKIAIKSHLPVWF